MRPAEFVTSIKRFAGYLRLSDEVARPPASAIDGGWLAQAASAAPTDDRAPGHDERRVGTSGQPNNAPTPLTPAGSAAAAAAGQHGSFGQGAGHAALHKAATPLAAKILDGHPAASDLGPMLPAAELHAATAVLAASAPDDHGHPSQLLLSATQINIMQSDGQVLDGTPDSLAAAAAHPGGLGLPLDGLKPLDGIVPTTGDVIAMVAAHDAAEANAPETAGHASLQPGLYDNGVMQPAHAAYAPLIPGPPAQDPQGPGDGSAHPGLAVQTGGNLGLNVASILDDNTQRTGLVVDGSAYTTSALIQVNVLLSASHVAMDAAAAAAVSTTGDTATNLAAFGQQTAVSPLIAHAATGATVTVDVVQGDFYDVKNVVQVNALGSNDVVTHTTASSAFDIVDTGQNMQVNALSLGELNGGFDLIVVGGDYHAANVIVQQNVLLNGADVSVTDPQQPGGPLSIATGNNTVSNSASIDEIGATTFKPLSATLNSAIRHLLGGSLDADAAATLPGHGGSLHVLYVTGGFYDINLLSQINVLSNLDTVAASGAQAGGATTIATGSNALGNVASIVSVGTTSGFQYVGGQHYDDATLVQTNLIGSAADVSLGGVRTIDPGTLAGIDGAHLATALGHVGAGPLHDLFHS